MKIRIKAAEDVLINAKFYGSIEFETRANLVNIEFAAKADIVKMISNMIFMI